MSDVRGSNSLKAQSAMEYLMTYGWAILIIAVVLGALFQLGVFNGISVTGTSCVAVSGYFCRSPTLTTLGLLTFTLGQNTGVPLYNLQLACAATSDATGGPYPSMAFNSIITAGTNQGTVLPPSNTGNTLMNGQSLTISQLPCYASSGSQLSGSIGSGFAGYIWVNYTRQSGASTGASGSNPWNMVKAVNVHVKVAS